MAKFPRHRQTSFPRQRRQRFGERIPLPHASRAMGTQSPGGGRREGPGAGAASAGQGSCASCLHAGPSGTPRWRGNRQQNEVWAKWARSCGPNPHTGMLPALCWNPSSPPPPMVIGKGGSKLEVTMALPYPIVQHVLKQSGTPSPSPGRGRRRTHRPSKGHSAQLLLCPPPPP